MKKFEWKSVLALALTGVLALGLTACGSSDSKTADAGSAAAADGKAVYRTLDEIKESGTINIGVFSDKNPFGYVDENGEYQGYDVYYARKYSLQGTTQGRYLTGGVPPVRFSM